MAKSVTYGQMEDLLLALGFVKNEDTVNRITFRHANSEAVILLPRYSRDRKMREWHFVAVRATLDNFGFVNRDEFDAAIRNRGRVAS